MDSPIVSFCIATFQRYEVLEELVREILSVRTDKIEVVVCDDKSLDESIEQIREIKDTRLKIYVNEKNVGSSLNIHESLDKGNGKYLFYVNDRDNVDPFKIEKLVEILEELEKKDVAFARCCGAYDNTEKYHVFNAGKEALIQFACRIDHPTGYIFKRNVWRKIRNRRKFFENQSYGDYPVTQICAIMAQKYKGAFIYGDICDVKRHRINFSEMKSGYYLKRKDKRLWYTPEVMFRELKISQEFLGKLGVQKEIRDQIFIDRYSEYLAWCVTGYIDKITDPACTAHYNIYPRQDFFHVFFASILNGIKLWTKTFFLCIAVNKGMISQINKALQEEYARYFKDVLESKLYVRGKKQKKLTEKDSEIAKRETVLNIYESWVDVLTGKGMISEYLIKNGYFHTAIYGMGRIGRNLYKELRNSDVDVAFVIDQRLSRQTGDYEGVPCLNIESEFPYADMIIVTISGEVDEIMKELRRKVKKPVKSMNDILFVMEGRNGR